MFTTFLNLAWSALTTDIMNKMQNVKDHFEEEAQEFDQIIIKLIPYYQQMLDALITSIPHPENKRIKVIDLGCGTGTISKMVKTRYPLAVMHCVDIAPNMLEVARHKLSAYPDISYEEADLSHYYFSDSYDAVLSSLALHHLAADKDKMDLYSKVYEALNPDGIFFNADNVLGSNTVLQENDMVHWKYFMRKSVKEDELRQWIDVHEKEDHPANLIEQLHWLRNIGFIDIDVIWKYFNFAVYGGFKK
jgi:tRNA (cmo5U34)-methyltransferase